MKTIICKFFNRMQIHWKKGDQKYIADDFGNSSNSTESDEYFFLQYLLYNPLSYFSKHPVFFWLFCLGRKVSSQDKSIYTR